MGGFQFGGGHSDAGAQGFGEGFAVNDLGINHGMLQRSNVEPATP